MSGCLGVAMQVLSCFKMLLCGCFGVLCCLAIDRVFSVFDMELVSGC